MPAALRTFTKFALVFLAATTLAYGAVRLAGGAGDGRRSTSDPVVSTAWPDDMPAPEPTVTAPGFGHLDLQLGLVVVGDSVRAVDAAQPVALRAGSRFRVTIEADARAVIELRAIAPDGRTAARPLWRTTASPGRAAVSPSLQLAGARGLETLVVRARAVDGTATQERRLHILHL